MAGHGEKFSRLKESAVAAVIAERSLEAAARRVGVGVRTLRRWTKLEEFQEAVQAAKRDYLGAVMADLKDAALVAVRALRDVAQDAENPQRVKAADALLARLLQVHERREVVERLSALEHVASHAPPVTAAV